MKEKKSIKVSLGDVAKAAGISTTSAANALRNLPGLSPATRQRVLRVAKRLGYFPDPRLASRMTGIRLTADKDLLPIVWLNTNREKDAWSKYCFLSPYQEGARERLQELGYRIEEMWTREPGFSMHRLAQIIDHQGITGVIITEPARHIQLKWNRLAGVSIGGGLLAPVLHRITTDTNLNLRLALKIVKRFGYQRIGVCLTEEADRFSRHDARSAAMYFNSTLPKARQVHPLFMPNSKDSVTYGNIVAAWLKRERPDAIVGLSSKLVNWVEAAGFRVPDDIGVVHLAIEDDVLDWAGIYANKRVVGRFAANLLADLIRHEEFGVPSVALTTLVPGVWRSGRTLLTPKPKPSQGM
ncbi:MAG: LacI family DNA-binding transcriptional regulator [Methylacidiphilales bacterium]|nr:LacI family DNA-binding transcriptional regulator [Candidatus Methylacidiphilales bacterium]